MRKVRLLLLLACFILALLTVPAPALADDGPSQPVQQAIPRFPLQPNHPLAPTAPELVAGYTFSSSAGTYTAISGGTVHGTTTNDDNLFANIPIGFTFTLDTLSSTVVGICANGYVVLNLTTGTLCDTTYTPISGGTNNFLMSALGRDLESRTDGVLRSQTIGSAPNRVFVVQWTNYQNWNSAATNTGNIYTFQIRLYETTNVVEYVYGSFTGVNSQTAQVGLRGATNADYFNRTTTTNWAASAAGTANTATMSLSTTVLPASGLTYTFTPPPPANTWLGNTTDWHTASNWSLGSVPNTSNPVLIPTVPTGGNMPTVNAAATSGTLTIQTGATLSLVTGADLSLYSDLTVAGTLNATDGVVNIMTNTTLAGAGTKTFYNLTVNNGATLTPSTNMTVNGTMTVNGIVSHNAGSQTYNGPVNIGATSQVTYIGAGSHTYNGPLTIAAGGEWATVFNTGIANFNGLVTNNGILFVADTGTFNLNRDYTGTGLFEYYAGSGTINLAGTVAQTISGTPNFHNVVISNVAGVTAGATLTVRGNWTNNGLFNGSGQTVKFAGATTLAGTGTSSFGSVIVNGTVNAAAHNYTVSGNWTRQNTFTAGTGTATFNGTTQTISSFLEGAAAATYTRTEAPALAIPDAGCLTNNFAISTLTVTDTTLITDVNVIINVSHSWNADLDIYLVSPAADVIPLTIGYGGNNNGFQVTFNDEATASISSIPTTGNTLITGTYRPYGLLSDVDGQAVNGDWRLFVCDFETPDTGTINSWSMAINGLQTAAATNFNSVVIGGTSDTTTNGNLAIATNLTVNAGGLLDMGSNNVTVEGTLTNNGSLRQTRTVADGPAQTRFMNITNAAATVSKYYGVDITPNSTGLGNTTVTVQGNQVAGCTNEITDPVLTRCFNITPTTANLSTIRFWFTNAELNGQPANNLQIWDFAGPDWVQVGAPYTYSEAGITCASGGGSACWVQGVNINTFSPFVLASGFTPTAIHLQALNAQTVSSVFWLLLPLLLGLVTVWLWRRQAIVS